MIKLLDGSNRLLLLFGATSLAAVVKGALVCVACCGPSCRCPAPIPCRGMSPVVGGWLGVGLLAAAMRWNGDAGQAKASA